LRLTGIGSTAGLLPAGISQGTQIGYLRITPANQIERRPKGEGNRRLVATGHKAAALPFTMKTGTREYHTGGTSVPLISGAPIARSHIVIPN
jgi:hypothetical protein